MRVTLAALSLLFAGAASAEPCSSETIAGKWLLDEGAFCEIDLSEKGTFTQTECNLPGTYPYPKVRVFYAGTLRVDRDCSVVVTFKSEWHEPGYPPQTGADSGQAWISGDRTRIDGLIRVDRGRRRSFHMIRQSGLD